MKVFWTWILISLWQGGVCYFVPMQALTVRSETMQDTGLWYISTISFTLIIHTIVFKLYIESVYWNKVNVICGFASVLFYYLTIIVLNTENMAAVF
jgi:hypothetical protein